MYWTGLGFWLDVECEGDKRDRLWNPVYGEHRPPDAWFMLAKRPWRAISCFFRTSTRALSLTSWPDRLSTSASWSSSASTWSRWWWRQMIRVRKRRKSLTKSTSSLWLSSPESVSWRCSLWGNTSSWTAGMCLTSSSWSSPLGVSGHHTWWGSPASAWGCFGSSFKTRGTTNKLFKHVIH